MQRRHNGCASQQAVVGQPGTLDLSFNGTGKVFADFAEGDDFAFGAARQIDGKIILAGGCANGSSRDFCAVRYLPDGTLDTTFGNNGKAAVPMATPIACNNLAYAIKLQSDGKLLLAGRCRTGSTATSDLVIRFSLLRLTSAGQADASFNGNGFVTTQFGGQDDTARAVGLQSDGKIVLSGYCLNTARNRYEFCAARYTTSGALDTTFNASGAMPGKLMGAINQQDFASAMVVQPDDKLVLGGSCWNGTTYEFCTARYTVDGVLDTTFNSTGFVLTSLSSVGATQGLAIALQPDGKVLIAGSTVDVNQDKFGVARYTTSGALDPAFGDGGILRSTVGPGNDIVYGIAIAPDKKIVLVGNCTNNLAGVEGGYSAFCAQRFDTGGVQDLTFGNTPGYAAGSVVTQMSCPGCGNDTTNATLLQPDGRLLIAGFCNNGSDPAPRNEFCAVRYDMSSYACNLDIDQDGALNATTDGILLVRRLLGLSGTTLTSGATNSIGQRTLPLDVVAAIDPLRTDLTLNLDGSGSAPTAARDGLMLLRAMLGLTGTAVTQDAITGTPPRNTWAAIRTHLNTNCGTQFAQ
jgi:uncharacterized delta-60 repeat protein